MFGINGAAIATFIATIGYSISKLIVVHYKFQMQPFTKKSGIALVTIVLFFAIFYFWDLGWHPIAAIAVKSIVLGISYILIAYKFSISEDVSASIKALLNKF
jgi:hypothetical protein